HSRPTFHGDTIYAETAVIDARESSSRPDRGVVTVETRAFNQRGEEVCFFRRKVMVYKRDAAPPRLRPYESPATWRETGRTDGLRLLRDRGRRAAGPRGARRRRGRR